MNEYTNFETYLVSLWLNNEQMLYNYVQALVVSEHNLDTAKLQLKEFVLELVQTDDLKPIQTDLINAALDRVNWSELIHEQHTI